MNRKWLKIREGTKLQQKVAYYKVSVILVAATKSVYSCPTREKSAKSRSKEF